MEKEEFLRHVEKADSGCWEWQRGRHYSGYGVLMVGAGQLRRQVRAHRWAHELFVGPIPTGLSVLHRCDNPPCVNPAHLFLGTHTDNMADMVAKGRWRARLDLRERTHCVNGHEYTPDNTTNHSSGRGRQCRTCALDYKRRYRRRVRELSEMGG